MSIRSKLLAAASALLLVSGIGVVSTLTATPAHATQQEICDFSQPNDYCLNDWFNGGPSGSGTNIKMYTNGKGNEDFAEQAIERCSGTVVVQYTCPFADFNVDDDFLGDPVVQLTYDGGGSHGCVGLTSAGYTQLLGCNSTTSGSGGGFGTAWVDDGDGHLISVGETNACPLQNCGDMSNYCALIGGSFESQAFANVCDDSEDLWTGLTG